MSGQRSSRAQPRQGPKRNRGRGYVGKTHGGAVGPGWPTTSDGTMLKPGEREPVTLEGIAGEIVGKPYWSEDRGWLVKVQFPGTEPLVECNVERLTHA